MLVLMLDLRYKNMDLVIIYLGHEIVAILVVDYNKQGPSMVGVSHLKYKDSFLRPPNSPFFL
jgi:hypothetical protein